MFNRNRTSAATRRRVPFAAGLRLGSYGAPLQISSYRFKGTASWRKKAEKVREREQERKERFHFRRICSKAPGAGHIIALRRRIAMACGLQGHGPLNKYLSRGPWLGTIAAVLTMNPVAFYSLPIHLYSLMALHSLRQQSCMSLTAADVFFKHHTTAHVRAVTSVVPRT